MFYYLFLYESVYKNLSDSKILSPDSQQSYDAPRERKDNERWRVTLRVVLGCEPALRVPDISNVTAKWHCITQVVSVKTPNCFTATTTCQRLTRRARCTVSLSLSPIFRTRVHAYVRACVRAYVRACARTYVRACVRACMRACATFAA